MKLYEAIAQKIDAYLRCLANGNDEWREKHVASIVELEEELPSGSGLERGCHVDLGRSTGVKVVINGSYHVMENGFYTRWIDFKVDALASLAFGIELRIKGNFGGKCQDIKDHLYELFQDVLTQEVDDFPNPHEQRVE